MENQKARSFKPLTISAENLPASTGRQANLTNYAAGRAKLLLGCYRTGEANDPETYVAAITAVLSRYPEEIMTSVTHPVTGLPAKSSWLPTVKEVTDACNAAVAPIAENEARLSRVKDQLEMRERMERGERPSLEKLQEKYGKDWGITIEPERPSKPFKAPSWDEIKAIYSADPSRLARLVPEKFRVTASNSSITQGEHDGARSLEEKTAGGLSGDSRAHR